MQFYKTIENANGKIEIKPITGKVYFTVCNGFSVVIFKQGRRWNVTEVITGSSWNNYGYTTLKQATQEVMKTDLKIVTEAIQRQIEYIKKKGVKLPNLIAAKQTI